MRTFSLRFSSRLSKQLDDQRGFTITEVLIVALILGILLIISMINAPKFIARANDSRRKSDLEALKISFERYFEDRGCYPDPSIVSSCASNGLAPYLPIIPCDPSAHLPYTYVRDDCKTFKLYTRLSDTDDPEIVKVGCGSGCGPDTDGNGQPDYNYGVSSGNTNAGNPIGTSIPGQCNIGGQSNRCYPNVCSSCCPGSDYRCNALGTACVPDASCAGM